MTDYHGGDEPPSWNNSPLDLKGGKVKLEEEGGTMCSASITEHDYIILR